MKLVIIAKDTSTSWYVINELRKNSKNMLIALEKNESKIKFLKKKLKKNSFINTIGQILFRVFFSLLSLSNRNYLNFLAKKYNLDDNRNYGLINRNFRSINSNECIDWLKKENPDFVVINGTSIIKKDVLESCSAYFINTHCGITPKYRGVHGAYWALVNRDLANVGVTIHVVDSGVDTGSIIYQASIDVEKKDTIVSYPLKQYKEGIILLKKIINDINKNEFKIYKSSYENSRIWEHPTLMGYLKNWIISGIR